MREVTNRYQIFEAALEPDEKRIFNANFEELDAFETINNADVRLYVEAARLLAALEDSHELYNKVSEKYFSSKHAAVERLAEESFRVVVAVGRYSSSSALYIQDECVLLYDYLQKLKIYRVEQLTEDLVIYMLNVLDDHGLL